MRPLPTSPEDVTKPAPSKPRAPVHVDSLLETGSGGGSNHRRNSPRSASAYPWLLGAATLLAGVFCLLYIFKPVVQTAAPAEPTAAKEEQLADGNPESGSENADSTRLTASSPADMSEDGEEGGTHAFEETNLRIQHILGARGPADEKLGRIVLDVPVLYESGTIRWSRQDVAQARSLLVRLQEYQAKSRQLRQEAVELISEWDQLVVSSIPESSLRADSPALPENQGPGSAENTSLKSTQAIELESP